MLCRHPVLYYQQTHTRYYCVTDWLKIHSVNQDRQIRRKRLPRGVESSTEGTISQHNGVRSNLYRICYVYELRRLQGEVTDQMWCARKWVVCKCFTYVAKTIANSTTYSRKSGDYNGTIIFEFDVNLTQFKIHIFGHCENQNNTARLTALSAQLLSVTI